MFDYPLKKKIFYGIDFLMLYLFALFSFFRIHHVKESLLSNESGFTNFRGLINWGTILLLIFGGKMFLNNLNR